VLPFVFRSYATAGLKTLLVSRTLSTVLCFGS